MDRWHKSLFVFLLCLGCNTGSRASDTLKTFVADGRIRSYEIFVPAGLRENAPLVFAMHGYGGSAAGIREFSQFDKLAEEEGFAVCYPEGWMGTDSLRSWNAGYSNPQVDDVKFLSALAKHLQEQFRLSRKNTFCTGMSNGADMCYVLACHRPDIFKAIAPVAGCMMESTLMHCSHPDGIPVFETHGTDDLITLYQGDPDYSEVYGGYLGTEGTMAYWVQKNGCTRFTSDTIPDADPADGSVVVRELYQGGTAGHQVWLYKLVGGKHDWPGTWGNMDIRISEEIWKFFQLWIE
jgi:polyhydroxybutyrate depolymerase